MRKKLFLLSSLFLLLCSLFPAIAFGASSGNISVYVSGQKLTFSSPPFEAHYTTLVPMRGVFEKVGATLIYDAKTKTIKAVKGSTTVLLVVGQNVAFVNGESVMLTTPAVQKNGVTFVPLRFITQALSCQVAYDPIKKRIDITPAPASSTPPASSGNSNTNTGTASSNGSSGDAASTNLSIEEVGKLADRVVYIETYDAAQRPIASGSGVVVGANGDILTNDHVIEGASSASVVFSDGTKVSTQTVTIADETRDLALLQISKTNLPSVTIGDSSKLVLGQQVVAIGSPLGLSGTLTVGVVSSTVRQVDGENYIQTSTPIDHGSSGGALFNLHGELVGITSAFIDSSANLGLAIPSNDVKQFLSQPRQTLAMASVNPAPASSSASASGSVTADDVQNYLSSEYATLTYKDLQLDFDWYVHVDAEGTFYVAGFMQDGMQWVNWEDEQDADPDTLPLAVAFIANALKDHFGLTDTFITFITDFHVNEYPDGMSSDYVTTDGSGYRIQLPFIYGVPDYSTNTLYYNDNPADSDVIDTMPLS